MCARGAAHGTHLNPLSPNGTQIHFAWSRTILTQFMTRHTYIPLPHPTTPNGVVDLIPPTPLQKLPPDPHPHPTPQSISSPSSSPSPFSESETAVWLPREPGFPSNRRLGLGTVPIHPLCADPSPMAPASPLLTAVHTASINSLSLSQP